MLFMNRQVFLFRFLFREFFISIVFFKIRQKKGLWIPWSKRLESFVKLMSKNSISGLHLWKSQYWRNAFVSRRENIDGHRGERHREERITCYFNGDDKTSSARYNSPRTRSGGRTEYNSFASHCSIQNSLHPPSISLSLSSLWVTAAKGSCLVGRVCTL